MKILWIALILVFGLLAGCSAQINGDSADVNQVAAEIVDFTLPADYVPEFSASALGYTAVSYTPGDDRSHLYLVQSSNQDDAEELAKMLNQLIPGASDAKSRTTVLENRPVIVRGQATTAVITEGTNAEEKVYRQALVAFEGKGG
ncbi:MAG: hypothetical protein HY835_10845, partial [Anaerolineae bacterium]|nr:hypothetical protein [Anaerolineae bacterium]